MSTQPTCAPPSGVVSDDQSPLERAIALFDTQEAFAAALGIKSPSVSRWRKTRRVPVDRCRAVEAATRGKVTRYELRPDVFGEAPAANLREAG